LADWRKIAYTEALTAKSLVKLTVTLYDMMSEQEKVRFD